MMTNAMRFGAVCILLFLSNTTVRAQLLEKVKKKAEEYAPKAFNGLTKARDAFDSTDFDYAILLSDNSGLFDIKEKGERSSKLTTLAGLGASFYKNTEFTDAERARFNLEMGETLYASEKYSMAEKKFLAAKAAYEKANLTEDIGYLKTLSNQGLLYSTMGRFTQAEGFTVEALDMRKTKFGDNNPSVAASLNNYGVLKYNLARYDESDKDFEAAVAILKANGKQGEMPYAITLNNQAILLQEIGRYDEAVQRLTQAITIAEKGLNDKEKTKSRNNLKFLSNLALLYQQMGKYTEAEAIYLSMEKRLGKNNPDYANMLSNQAALYIVMGKEEKVEELLKKSAGIYKDALGENTPAYAKAASDLGNYYRYKARDTDAAPLLDKALAVREATLGKNHPLYAQSQEDIAILYWKTTAWDKAVPLYHEVMDKSLQFINTYFPPMSEAEKTRYWDVLSPRFQRFYNFALEASASNPAVVKDLIDYQIATKALLLNSTNKVKQAIFASKDGELIRDYVLWLDQKETLARLYAYSTKELEEQNIQLDSLQRAANTMERKLSARSADFSAGYANQKISYTQVKNTLTDTEAIVEIIRLQRYGQKFTEDAQYVALVLTKAAELPKIIVLENGGQLETRYAKFYRNAIQQRLADEYSYDQYWARIEPALTGKKVVYVSPDGVYNQLNLNTLKKPDAGYVINRYDLVTLGNSKDLIALKARKAQAPKKTATLVGFPDYGGSDVTALPGTKVEIDNVTKVLKTAGYQVTPFTQKTATEANIKKLKAPMLVHIATHGYFLKDVDSGNSAFGISLDNANNNPLLRSGLLLSGAATTVSGKRMPDLGSNDNGVLTAYEAMNLSLDGTALVVLSACETGLGDVKAGEGVYGLQRAFLVAGAEALIMSLWKVDDAATQQLMSSFYTNWVKLGNKQKAFKQAQLQLMSKYKDPYYWGAFVMMER